MPKTSSKRGSRRGDRRLRNGTVNVQATGVKTGVTLEVLTSRERRSLIRESQIRAKEKERDILQEMEREKTRLRVVADKEKAAKMVRERKQKSRSNQDAETKAKELQKNRERALIKKLTKSLGRVPSHVDIQDFAVEELRLKQMRKTCEIIAPAGETKEAERRRVATERKRFSRLKLMKVKEAIDS